jgi:hypothetical protein
VVGSLSLEKIFSGVEALYNPLRATLFTVTIPTRCCLDGEVVWVEKMLPEWIKVLTEKAKVNVIDFSVEDSHKIGDGRAKIVANLCVQGSFVLSTHFWRF